MLYDGGKSWVEWGEISRERKLVVCGVVLEIQTTGMKNEKECCIRLRKESFQLLTGDEEGRRQVESLCFFE